MSDTRLFKKKSFPSQKNLEYRLFTTIYWRGIYRIPIEQTIKSTKEALNLKVVITYQEKNMPKFKLKNVSLRDTPQGDLVNIGLIRLNKEIYPIAKIEEFLIEFSKMQRIFEKLNSSDQDPKICKPKH